MDMTEEDLQGLYTWVWLFKTVEGPSIVAQAAQ
jgi:hypothetical protein